ncbi:MAG: phosphoglucosamine mutase [Clostridia bacterium]|nr:phosphoglucosamine mutase [Clostridia bacterium]
MGKYFGTDGFRGEAGKTITAYHAYKVGRILGDLFGRRRGVKCRAVLGKDTRLSSYMLEYALAAGLTASGADAYILHVTTTPSVSYITRCDGFDIGIMISASHNPYFDNGIKIMNAQGEKIEDSVLSVIEDYLDDKIPEVPFASGEDIGRTVDYISGRNRYIGHLISLSTCSYKGLRIGLDAANGSAWQIARSVFDALGAKTYCIGDSPNGRNVNDGVGSTNIEKLVSLVRENSLDLGFAFDGDADRCICVDERGEVVTGDEEMYICADYLHSRGELAGDKIVCTVMSNGGLIKSLKKQGISCELSEVGDRNVCDLMNKTGAVLGGERSGHVVFSKYETTGDGLVTAIMIMEAVVESKQKLSRLLKGYKSLPQVSVNVPVRDKYSVMPALSAEAEKLQKSLQVRLVVRPSGTEQLVRIMAEGESKENCVTACESLRAMIKDEIE